MLNLMLALFFMCINTLNSQLSVLYMLMFCIMMLFSMKNISLSLFIMIISIVFISGILLLLFYLSTMNINMPTWSEIYLMGPIMLSPSLYLKNNYMYSSNSLSLEMYTSSVLMSLGSMLMVMLVSLLLISGFMNQIKWMRQLH